MENNTCSGEKEQASLLLVLSIGGMVASLACMLSLMLVLKFKLYKHLSHRLASYQVLSSLFFGIVLSVELVFTNYHKNEKLYEPLCKMVGFLFEYGVWLKLLFMMWLTLHLFCFTVCHWSTEKKEVLIFICLALLPFLFIWVPFINELYGLAGAWCWIKNQSGTCGKDRLVIGMIEQYALLYVPVFLVLLGLIILLSVLMLFMAVKSSKQRPIEDEVLLVENRQRKKALKQLLPLSAYPILTFIFIIPPCINRIYEDVTPGFSFPAFMASVVTISFPSLFSGLTLLIHMMVLKCARRKLRRPPENDDDEWTSFSDNEHCMTKYTRYTLGSTDCQTRFSLPRESESDDTFLDT